MTKILALSALLLMPLASGSYAQYINLGSLGSSDFTIDPGSTGSFSQSSTAVTFTSAGLGDQVFGSYTPSNWSAFTDFGIRMTVTGTNPDLPFSIYFFDSGFQQSQYQGTTSGLLDGVSGVAPLTLITSEADMSNIVGFQIGLDGAVSSMNVSMTDVAAVPEPSTYALLALGGLALGAYVLRRRQRA